MKKFWQYFFTDVSLEEVTDIVIEKNEKGEISWIFLAKILSEVINMNKKQQSSNKRRKRASIGLAVALPLLLCLQEPIHGEITGQM